MVLPLPKPCLDCGVLSPRPRCPACERAKEHRRKAHRTHPTGTHSATRLRDLVRRQGWATCALCATPHAAHLIEVDHRLPLADGGRDIDSNVQALCRSCHRAKTAREATERSQRRGRTG